MYTHNVYVCIYIYIYIYTHKSNYAGYDPSGEMPAAADAALRSALKSSCLAYLPYSILSANSVK